VHDVAKASATGCGPVGFSIVAEHEFCGQGVNVSMAEALSWSFSPADGRSAAAPHSGERGIDPGRGRGIAKKGLPCGFGVDGASCGTGCAFELPQAALVHRNLYTLNVGALPPRIGGKVGYEY